jgi:arsenate reductase
MSERVYRVLFLCTGNSARSILAEAILERLGPPRFRGFSAGSHPSRAPHPMALEILAARGYETANRRSKSWDEFSRPGAPKLDFVLTVCDMLSDRAVDGASDDACPIWSGEPISGHWGVEDPAAFEGPPDAVRACFERIYEQLRARIEEFVKLDPAAVTAEEMTASLTRIGASYS